MCETCVGLVLRHVPSARRPLEVRSPWYVLIELSDGQDESHAAALLESLLAMAFERALASDAAVSVSLAQFEAFWAVRENISAVQLMRNVTVGASEVRFRLFECQLELSMFTRFDTKHRDFQNHARLPVGCSTEMTLTAPSGTTAMPCATEPSSTQAVPTVTAASTPMASWHTCGMKLRY